MAFLVFTIISTFLGQALNGGAYLCSPVPMFPGNDVPRTYVPRCLCFPVPMFPGTDVPGFLLFNSGNSHKPFAN